MRHSLTKLVSLLLAAAPLACAADTAPSSGACVDGVWEGSATADDLAAVRGCPHIEGSLYLWDAEADTLDDLGELRSVSGALSILGSHALVDLSGLERLERVGGCLELAANDGLVDLRGAEALEEVGCLMVGRSVPSGKTFGNPSLVSLDGLGGLRRVERDLTIAHNRSLVALSGLEGLERVGGRDLAIHHNAALPSCRAEQFAERLNQQGYDGQVDIAGNDDEAVCPQ